MASAVVHPGEAVATPRRRRNLGADGALDFEHVRFLPNETGVAREDEAQPSRSSPGTGRFYHLSALGMIRTCDTRFRKPNSIEL